ncbi:methyltransferase, TIGR04325 family [Methylophilus aquaticus]|uniref:Methyltransferase, TIGR04325 family n=1 Tax=Methylophilus aquaticus TaxID=1971610 RepID=A0ABT9JVE6_9PROT|nr:methyltransferase, TIGR04325 family [Methylophilus aquaticus]MDP8568090.1 methyltransferase, TIGR04325 family [Methylophilus aquaticus]
MTLKKILKLLCPPILLKILAFFRHDRIQFTGDYASWNEAKNRAMGYDSDHIFEKVKQSSQKVVSGEAAYERDSVCFYEHTYRWPLLACLLLIANKQNNKLNIIDFGGALGSLYYQHRDFLSTIQEVNWSIVEQSHYVEYGKKQLQNQQLSFHLTLAESLKAGKADTVLLSSVLPYIEKPQKLLTEIAELGFKYILIDRTPFIQCEKDRLTIQSVPKSIYKASYPAWFFSEKEFDKLMHALGYKCIYEFDCDENFEFGEVKGFLFEKTS